ncbi:hypothetical protein CRUP_012673, partial [Coryphaenoides rupestris]
AAEQRQVYGLNLTSLQDSEVILSASFHFQLERRPRPRPWACKRFKSPACRPLPAHHPSPSVNILLYAVSPGSEVGLGSPGAFLGNLTLHPHRRDVWQMKDLTQVIKQARHRGHILLSLELDFGTPMHHRRQPEEALSVAVGGAPYLLLYADDRALAEPNSVAASLQRYDPLAEEEVGGGTDAPRLPGPTGRVRREAPAAFRAVHDNELPDVDVHRPDGYRSKESQLESTWYLALKSKSKLGAKEEKKKELEKKEKPRPQVLSFDEQTMRKARRRQWGGTAAAAAAATAAHGGGGGCSRKNLRVDFADIGWSEWVIAPKAFEAYYCSGTCGFPMAKVTRPSNHATIQSIVRAVGIVPGVPEPCCVPEKMNPLAVLYRDEARNPVLKVYPDMSVQSCSCR